MRFLALLLLSGCTSVDVICDMRTEYAKTAPMEESGRVELSWQYRSALQQGLYGLTRCVGSSCHLMMTGALAGSATHAGSPAC